MARAPQVGRTEEFGRGLIRLATRVAKAFPNDAALARAARRVRGGVDLAPVRLMQAVGEYLYRRRGQIYAADPGGATLFGEPDAAAGADIEDAKDARLVEYIVEKIDAFGCGLDPEGRAGVRGAVVELLDLYVEHKAAQSAARKER